MVMRPMVCAPIMAAVSRAEKSNWSRKKSSVASPFPSGLGWVSARSVLNCSCSPSYSDTQSARPDWNWISRGRTTWPQHSQERLSINILYLPHSPHPPCSSYNLSCCLTRQLKIQNCYSCSSRCLALPHIGSYSAPSCIQLQPWQHTPTNQP